MRDFASLRAPQVSEMVSNEAILVQPVGAIEQHGPHLPFNTDYVIADESARTLADRHGEDLDLWLLPTIAYSKSDEHSWSDGTVWMSSATMLSMLDDLGRSLTRLPAARLVFLNAHGGNSSLLNVACRDLRRVHGLSTFLLHPFVPPDQGGESASSEQGLGIHGGHLETSLMLHLRPDLVDMSAASPNLPQQLMSNQFVRFGGTGSFGWLSDDFGPDGHIGDPTGATSEDGRVAFEAAIDMLVASLGEIRDFEVRRR